MTILRTIIRPLILLLPAVLCSALESQATADEVRFSRHVVPLFSRLGCNAGLCHGSVHGKNGFRLALFGADPVQDHEQLTREFAGRRLNLAKPKKSLLLLKATGKIPHEGGKRTNVDSPEYEILHDWIANGAMLDVVEDSQITSLRVSPEQQTIQVDGNYQLKVEAGFADGTSQDVTSLCTYESANKDVAQVDKVGRVTGASVGDTALVVRYRSLPVVAMVVVPGSTSQPFPETATKNFVDEYILAKLRRLRIHPSELCDDATFLRRVSLDVTGALPSPDEVRKFLADDNPDKRAKQIRELLDRPGHAATWATKFCDILRPAGFDSRHGFTEAAETRRFYQWLWARIEENTPYDQLAERILMATSREGRSASDWSDEVRALCEENSAKKGDLAGYAKRRTLDLYWQRSESSGVKGTLQIAHAFLGLRMECAQCHRHPNDVWQQDDLLSFANLFMRVSNVGAKPSAEIAKQAESFSAEIKQLKEKAKEVGQRAKDKSLAKDEMNKLKAESKQLSEQARVLENIAKRLKGTEVRNIAAGKYATVSSPLGSQTSQEFRLLGQSEAIEVPADADPWQFVVDWLRSPDNPFFAKAIVNRVWAHYFGRGIIDPPDHLSPLNPASHPELLDELARRFIENKYDLKWLHLTILESNTYQTSAKTNDTNRNDKANYASFYLRRLPAEVLVDAINTVTGGSETYPADLYLPADAKAIEVAGVTTVGRASSSVEYAFKIFGRPQRRREVQCDCERDTTATIVQTLYMANHPQVVKKAFSTDGRVAQIIEQFADNAQRIEQLFLCALSRLPTEVERQKCVEYIGASESPQVGLADVMWSLLNTQEFLLQH